MFDFSGQFVIVTGGTRGIGRAVSTAFLKAGASVAATYASHEDTATSLRQEQAAVGERLSLARFDVADGQAVAAFFADLATRNQVPQVLVNCAGIRRDTVLAMMPAADWERVLAVNLGGTYHTCKFAVQAMMPQRYGRIINITSPCGHFGFAGQANYAASKAGIVALTRSLSKEVAKRKITVNCVSPGFTETDFLAGLGPEAVAEYRRSVPLGRFAQPEEVAWAVLFLATREAAYITGATLDVTGGL